MKRFTLAFAFLLTLSLAFTSCNDSQKKDAKKVEKEIKKETKKVEKVVKEDAKKTEEAVSKEADKVKTDLAMNDYQCPMKCEGEKVYHKPGKCPKCNMDLKKVKKK